MDMPYIIENIVPRGNERIGSLFQTYGRQNELYKRDDRNSSYMSLLRD